MAAHKPLLMTFAALALGASACRTNNAAEPEASSVAAAPADTSETAATPAAQSSGIGLKAQLKPKGLGATQMWEDGKGGEWRYFNKRLGWDEAFAKCDLLAKTLKKRWRLPSPVELQESLKTGILSSKNPSFGWVYLNNTWSGTWDTVAGNKVATYVDMASGRKYTTAIDHQMSVVCLLTTDPSGDTWTDDKTSQVWRYAGDDKEWSTADKTCRTMARNDRLPWRLPTTAEIDAAMKHGIQTDANASFGRQYITLTWTAEANTTYGPESYAVDLRNGSLFLLTREQKLHTLCVRPLHH